MEHQFLYKNNLKMCKMCCKDKPYIYSHICPSNKSKIYLDDTGRQWRTQFCPDCVMENQRKRRAKSKALRELKKQQMQEQNNGK